MQLIIKFILFFLPGLLCSQGLLNNGYIVLSDSSKIVLSNAHFENNSIFISDASTIKFIGNQNQFILGDSISSFYKIIVDKTNSDLVLNQNISILNQLTMLNGDIDLQNDTIDLLSSGYIDGEAENHRIKVSDPMIHTGIIKYTRVINNVADYDPANIGVSITTDNNLGEITVIRGHLKYYGIDYNEDNLSIARYYIVPNINELDGTDNTLKFNFWNAELDANQPIESNMILYQSIEENASSFWSDLSMTIDTVNNIITPQLNPYSTYVYGDAYTGITFNSLFTFGSKETPLPIELLSFNAKKEGNQVKIFWQTASEINVNFYQIQKSTDLIKWELVSQLKGKGNSNVTSEYTEFDRNPYVGTSYYRLLELDNNGAINYSDNVEVNFLDNQLFNIYPNPASDHIAVENSQFDRPNNQIVQSVEIFNLSGQLIKFFPLGIEIEPFKMKSEKIFEVDISDLPKGVYILNVKSESGKSTYRLIKE
ncbi:MAG: T9SS type A sorting domain-containing protein [Bacteroidales bacterium]|nr:T9SS type A sorting domain-containing protein [Bacteroidales bacterium]